MLRRVWIPSILLMLCMTVIGFIIGNNSATSHYKKALSEVDETYRQAGEKRRVILSQCLANNDKLTARLAELGDKVATALDKPVIVESDR